MDGIISLHRQMMAFQKANNIEKKCVANTQYLLDCLRCSGYSEAKAKAVIFIRLEDETKTLTFVSGHLVISVGSEVVLDPSYEWSSKEGEYFESLGDLLKTYPFIKDWDTFKENAKIHLVFCNIAKEMNSGTLCVDKDSKDYYNALADYCEQDLHHQSQRSGSGVQVACSS